MLIRRTKQEVGGFTRRCARTVRFDLYPDERELYDETTRYVAEEFNRAMQSENRAVGFVMTIFQKLLDSSTRALGCALERRMHRLEELADRAEIERRMDREAAIEEPDLIDDAEDVDDLVCIASREDHRGDEEGDRDPAPPCRSVEDRSASTRRPRSSCASSAI